MAEHTEAPHVAYWEEAHAKSRLIAAAPALLAACKAAHKDLACVQLCLLQQDREGALEILGRYGRMKFDNGPNFECAAIALAEQEPPHAHD